MPSHTTVEAFVAAVESGDFVGAIERFYASGAYMQENQAKPRVGRERLIADEARVMSGATIAGQCIDTPMIQGDRVAIRWKFEFTFPNGKGFVMKEIAWQRWLGDEIIEETFFYDPAQMTP